MLAAAAEAVAVEPGDGDSDVLACLAGPQFQPAAGLVGPLPRDFNIIGQAAPAFPREAWR
jgi:hypothetical protein